MNQKSISTFGDTRTCPIHMQTIVSHPESTILNLWRHLGSYFRHIYPLLQSSRAHILFSEISIPRN